MHSSTQQNLPTKPFRASFQLIPGRAENQQIMVKKTGKSTIRVKKMRFFHEKTHFFRSGH